jgi:hypothetical protein
MHCGKTDKIHLAAVPEFIFAAHNRKLQKLYMHAR